MRIKCPDSQSQGKRMLFVTERLRWSAQKPTWRQKIWRLVTRPSPCEIGHFTDMKLKVLQFALRNSTLKKWGGLQIMQRSGEDVKFIYFQWFISIQDNVGFIQVILFGLCVWENLRKSPSRGNVCETWMQLGFPTFLMIKTIGITHLEVFTFSDESSFRSQEVILWHLTKT